MVSGYDMVEAIYNNIVHTYHTDMEKYLWRSRDTRDEVDHVISVTMDIVSAIAATALETGKRGEYERENVFQIIQNKIWIWYPGGTTAAASAGRICDDLGIDWPRDEKF